MHECRPTQRASIPGKERRSHGGGTLRVFRHFARLEIDSDKIVLSRPAHQYPKGA
jgi:hypothetical protein